MKKWKSNRGSITLFVLIALLFFIGVLLSSYLSSINSRKAQDDATQRVKDIYEKDIGRMDEIYDEIAKQLVDDIKIPQDFTREEGDKLEDGIVVQDSKGNQYVWIPVTKNEDGTPTDPYIATNGKLTTSKGEVEIQLQRYDFSGSDDLTSKYTEDTPSNHNSSYKNAIAEDITEFKESVAENGGYFLGRYKAGIEGGTLASTSNSDSDRNWTGWTGGTLVCKQEQEVWNYVTQNKASELCKNIDTENNYTDLTSDLVNSYAFDTAVIFIQTCGSESDDQCNIDALISASDEWTTETYNLYASPCVYRSNKRRARTRTFAAYSHNFFRPILYWNS